MEAQAKAQYNMLKKSGDLLDLYPELSGESWAKDKKDFTEIYTLTMNGVIDMEVDYDIEDGAVSKSMLLEG